MFGYCAEDLKTQSMVNRFHGQQHLKNKILTHGCHEKPSFAIAKTDGGDGSSVFLYFSFFYYYYFICVF